MQIAKSWRRQGSHLRMEGVMCTKCKTLAFPAVMICTNCGESELDMYQFKGTGRVIEYTVVYEAPENFNEQVPYIAALVKLDEGITVTAMLTDVEIDEVSDNMPVNMVTRRIASIGEKGPIVYAYKFAPII
ncbi:MAG: Zn-ribbon domain-containing OB-fold protein [Deltaproteobacteria bacterium]|nr:Zn-ribbon domain-containing OB-fold protein [Deltaproteobacteria bacterium]